MNRHVMNMNPGTAHSIARVGSRSPWPRPVPALAYGRSFASNGIGGIDVLK